MSAPCAECGTPRGRDGARRVRGLCLLCHERALRGGTLDRVYRAAGDVLEDLAWIGFDERQPVRPQLREFAPRLGVTLAALERAYYRDVAARQRRSA